MGSRRRMLGVGSLGQLWGGRFLLSGPLILRAVLNDGESVSLAGTERSHLQDTVLHPQTGLLEGQGRLQARGSSEREKRQSLFLSWIARDPFLILTRDSQSEARTGKRRKQKKQVRAQ